MNEGYSSNIIYMCLKQNTEVNVITIPMSYTASHEEAERA